MKKNSVIYISNLKKTNEYDVVLEQHKRNMAMLEQMQKDIERKRKSDSVLNFTLFIFLSLSIGSMVGAIIRPFV